MIYALLLQLWLIIFLVETSGLLILFIVNCTYRKKIVELTMQLQNRKDGSGAHTSIPAATAEKPVVKFAARTLPTATENTVRDEKHNSEPECTVPVRRSATPPVGMAPATPPVGIVPSAPPVGIAPATPPVGIAPAAPPVEKPAADRKKAYGTAALVIGVVFVVLAGLIFATTSWRVLPSFGKVVLIFGFSGVFFGTSQLARTLFKIQKTSQAFYILGSIFLCFTVIAIGYFRLFGDRFTMAEQYRFHVLLAGSLLTEITLLAGLKRFQDKIYTMSCLWGISVIIFFFVKALNLNTLDGVKVICIYAAVLIMIDELSKDQRAVLPAYLKLKFTAFARLHFAIFGTGVVLILGFEWLCFIFEHLIHHSATLPLLTVLAIGLIAAAILVMALKQKEQKFQILLAIAFIVFWHSVGMSIDVALIYQILLGASLTAGWLLTERWKKGHLHSAATNCLYTLILVFDTLVILPLAYLQWNTLGDYFAVFTVVVLLAAVTVQWSHKNQMVRGFIPFVLYLLTTVAEGVLDYYQWTLLTYDQIVFFFLLLIIIWDLKKRDQFGIAIIVIGTVAQLGFWLAGGGVPFFALLLSSYLFFQSVRVKRQQSTWYERGGCIYLLAGVFFLADHFTDIILIPMICVALVFAVEYAILYRYRKAEVRHNLWEVTGIVIVLFMMAAYYQDDRRGAGYLVACLSILGLYYVVFYRCNRKWGHLLTALLILPIPSMAARRYALTESHLYGFTAAAVLLSGSFARYFVPVIYCRGEEEQEWQFDWLHILVILTLVPMTVTASAGWQVAYLLLMALYVLQYTVLPVLRKEALTVAAALLVLAFWSQPFLSVPRLLTLEAKLLPVAMFTYYLGYIWKEKKDISRVQNSLYMVCLGSLFIAALRTGLVIDALILEVICLAVFMGAILKKHVLWMRIAGTIIVVVALYMTKTFWLSLSWWIYLLAAGLGLIIFAAASEMKKQ